MNLAAPIAAAQIIANIIAPRPDLIVAWDAPTNGAPDYYELQTSTNLMQWQSILLTNITAFPIHFADAPCCFFRVRDWSDVRFSDWASVQTINSQPSTKN